MTRMFDRRAFLIGGGAAAGAALLDVAAAARTGTSMLQQRNLPHVEGLPAAAVESVGVAPDVSARIDAFMQSQIDKGNLTGGVTAFARRGKLVHFAAHGLADREAGVPMTTDRMFRMMSSTKPITGVALLQQIEEGKVSLDDKVSRFIPELKDMRVRVGGGDGTPVETVPATREITVRDLATHTSGLNGSLVDVPSGVPYTLAARIPYARYISLDFQPGARWGYSAATGPDVLARLIEVTSGTSFDHYLRERIFEPIGMRDSVFNPTDAQRARIVPRYTRAGDGWHRETHDLELAEKLLGRAGLTNPKTTYFPGAFGLYSTAHDYLLFETMLLGKGSIHGRSVLRPESVQLMHTNLVGDMYDGGSAYPNSRGTGFGILVRTVLDPSTCACARAAGAFGWAGAYGTTSWTDPANELVAVYMVQQRAREAAAEYERVIAGSLQA